MWAAQFFPLVLAVVTGITSEAVKKFGHGQKIFEKVANIWDLQLAPVVHPHQSCGHPTGNKRLRTQIFNEPASARIQSGANILAVFAHKPGRMA
jgi:hypothetical protein